MATASRIKAEAEIMVRNHGGQQYFNFTECAKIVGCDKSIIPRILHNSGVLIKKDGKLKMVSAYDLAECMLSKQSSPID